MKACRGKYRWAVEILVRVPGKRTRRLKTVREGCAKSRAAAVKRVGKRALAELYLHGRHVGTIKEGRFVRW